MSNLKRLFLGTLFAMQPLDNTNAAVEMEVQTSTIGHHFFVIRPSMPSTVQDFLIDQDQASGGGGVLPDVSVNWDTNSQFALTVSAPPGKKFLVRVPAGRAVGFAGFLWWQSGGGGISPPGSVAASFEGLEGTPPGFSESTPSLSDSHGFFGFSDLDGMLVTNDFAFTSIRLTATVVPQFTGNGTEDYVPHHGSRMQIYYRTSETNDPGQFVFIVPAGTNAPPTNNVLPVVNLTRPTNGAVFAVGTPIFLTASATDADGTVSFVDFFAGSLNLGRASGPSTNDLYNLVWSNAPAGMFQVRAEAVDNAGGRGVSAQVQISVSGVTNVPPTNIAPVVKLTLPTNGAIFAEGTPILLTASVSDSDGTLSLIDFLAGTNLLGSLSGPLINGVYNFAWSNAPAGAFQLRAEAVDNVGARSASASVQIAVGGQILLTFDDLSPGAEWVPLPARYGSLRWSYFAAYNGGNRPATEGYHTGMISSNNVAFNVNGEPASLSSPTLFDLNSAYLTAAFVDGLHVRVQGFAGPILAYDNTYALHPTQPTFIQFNYLGVDWVKFTPSPASQFVMDNLTVTLSDRVPPVSAVDAGHIEVSTVGHSFATVVSDFLIDQDQSSGGGGVLPPVAVNWDTNNQFKLTVSAPAGMKFAVNAPAGRLVKFGGFLWWESTRGGFSGSGPVTATFTDLEGVAPGFTESDSVLSDSHGFFGFVDLEGTGVTNSFAFTSITLTGTVAPQYTGNGTEDYAAHRGSNMRLFYTPAEPGDPGSFVSIVPAVSLPVIRVIGISLETGVDLMIYGQAGRTHIVECSEDTVTWTPISSAVMSAASSMPVRDASPATVNSRFYRVVEVP